MTPDAPGTPDASQAPDTPETPEIPQAQESPKEPGNDRAPEAPEQPSGASGASSDAAVQENAERLGPQSVEPRESAPVLKPLPGGPLPTGKPDGKGAARPLAKPDSSVAGRAPGVKKPALKAVPAGTTPVAPVTDQKKIAVCRIINARVERMDQPEPGDLSCQVPRPVALKDMGKDSVVTFSPQAVLDCEMAETVAAWVREVVRPAVREIFGTSLKQLRVASSFVCRRRNNLPDGKLSEHGRGNAIDISAFTLGDGRVVTVKAGWHGEADERKFLAQVRKQACDRFTTVLSPDGDAYHQDHLHLDVGCHGKTCTYRICH
ncbi:extensin family protein [Breoghania sp. L-A4]|uniref:extensin-like domain-containing protein n=1 Tax=Breoghania sp. L-A4 TaxID=2304600 RepID=UPI0013C3155E|nr:extensin family protein [Breoghania sp. L-A4]